MEDSSELLRKIKIILKVFNKLTYFFTCKSSIFQKHFENEMFFLQYYHKVRYFTNKNLIFNKKINQEMNFLILWFLRDKTGSIIFVVGKSPIDIMEPIFV